MSTAIILDTETTDKELPEVIELAWRGFALGPVIGGLSGRGSARFKPKSPSKWGALATHHILMEELEGLPPSAGALAEVPAADYWIGHNVDFDWKALDMPPVKRICTLAMARRLWPEVDSHSLTALMYFVCGATAATREVVRHAHGAAADVEMCGEILRAIIAVAKVNSLEQLYMFSEEARIPTHWTFGKFKDQPIEAADRGYANWCRRQPDFDPYVLEALRRAGL